MVSLLGQLTELGSLFSGVAASDPLSALLLAVGALVTVGSSAFVTYLVLGALVDLVIPERIGRTRRPGA